MEVATFSLIPREKSREDKHNDTIQLDPEFIEFKEKYEAEEGEVQQVNFKILSQFSSNVDLNHFLRFSYFS